MQLHRNGFLAIGLASSIVGSTLHAQTIAPPPIFNDRTGSNPPSCDYAAQGSVCGTDCRCIPDVQSVGWPCDGCLGSGRWPEFASLFYAHAPTKCASFNFIDLPLLDLPAGLTGGSTPSLAPTYFIQLTPIGGLSRIREVPLECSPERDPVDAAARFKIDLGGSGSGGADCKGAVFFVTAEFDPTLFEIRLYGEVRSGSSFLCGSTELAPYSPRLIIRSPIFTTNDLRYPDLVANPHYVTVSLKAGRSPRDAGNRSVRLRAHSFNWGGDHSVLCDPFGCDEGYRFSPSGAFHVQVFDLELPPNWCQESRPLGADEALPIATLSDAQRRSAEFDGIGARALNELTAELPTLKVGHNRFRAGRTLEESIGVDAYWHDSFGCNSFHRVNLFGVWCAVEDLPGWTSAPSGNDLVVHDPCEGLDYHYRNPDGSGILGETPLKLAVVKRGGQTIRTYVYSGGGVAGDLVSQTDVDGNAIAYASAPAGADTQLTVTGSATGGGTRIVTALYSSSGFLKSATWSGGGPSRQYEYIVDPFSPAVDGRIDRVRDAGGNILLDFTYDDEGRLIETSRGEGAALQTLNRHTYIDTPGTGQPVGDTYLVSQCFVEATQYQATIRTFDSFNRIVAEEEFHELQTLPVDSSAIPAFTGLSSTTSTQYRKDVSLDVPGGFFTIEKDLPSGDAAQYTIFDFNFNIIRTFMAEPDLETIVGAVLVNEKWMTHGMFGGVWQTTSEVDIARDSATTNMGYDASTGMLTSRTMPSISAANSGSGCAIGGRTETFAYDAVNRKRINTETRSDAQGGTINITNVFDAYDRPMTRTETGACDTHVTQTTHNAFGQTIRGTDVDGFVTEKVYDLAGHPNTGSGLLLGQRAYQTGSSGPVLEQTRYFYFTSSSHRGRLQRIEIADHEGAFTADSPAGWQVTTFAYDVYGRVSTKTTTHTGKPGTHVWTYAYDRQDRVAQVAYPDNMWVRTLREGRGMTVNEQVGTGGDALAGAGGTVVLTNTYAFDLNGNLIDRLNRTAADWPDHTQFVRDIYNRLRHRIDRDDGSIGYDAVTELEYNAGTDVVREAVREGEAGPILVDRRMDFDELGRVWKETILESPMAGLNPVRDRILITTFDVGGNEVGSRVADAVAGDELITRAYTCFGLTDSATQVLNGSESAFTDYTPDRRGNVKIVVDSVGNRTEHDYDALARRVESRDFELVGGAAVLQLRTDTIYTSREQRARQTQFDASSHAIDQQRWEYDTLGFQARWARMGDPASVAAASTTVDRVIDTASDGLGRMLSRTTYAGGVSRVTAQAYDTIGRITAVTHPVAGNTEALTYHPNSTRQHTRTVLDEIGSHATSTEFDSFGRLASETAEAIAPAAAITTSYLYDAAGRRVETSDPLGYAARSVYDGIGQLVSTTGDFGGADQRTVTFTYRQKGDLHTQTADDGEGPQVTTFAHDRAGRRTSVQHPNGSSKLMGYDLAGRMNTHQAEDGFITFHRHNWRGQVVEMRQTNASGAILESFAFDPLGRMTATAVGALASASYKSTYVYGNGTDVDGDAVVDPAYVDMPAGNTQTVAGLSKSFGCAYNVSGERTRLDYPADAETSLVFARDKFGQVTAIDRNASRLANYTYAGRQPVTRQVRTTASPGETWIELAWSRPDQLRRPAAIANRLRTGSTSGVGGTVASLVTYANGFDAAGNLDTQTVAGHPIAAENGLVDHFYDRLHRLTSTNYPNTAQDESWQLDDLGNWMSHAGRDGMTATFSDNSLNQYTSVSGQTTAPLHDAKGNLVRDDRGYGFTYDFRNRLTRVFSDNAPSNGLYDSGETVHAEFVVDALGRRVRVTQAGAGCGTAPCPSTVTHRYYEPDGSDLVLVEYEFSSAVSACCTGQAGSCMQQSEAACAASAGVWAGLDAGGAAIDCAATPCGTGACCHDGGACEQTTESSCASGGFVCNVTTNETPSCGGPCGTVCYCDVDGNGVVTPSDRGFISANINQTAHNLVCQYDLDGNGFINPGDRGFVSVNLMLCLALPDWQNGSGCNHGVCPDPRFGGGLPGQWQGYGSACAACASGGPAPFDRLFIHGPTYLDEHVLVKTGGPPGPEHYFLQKDLYTVAGLASAGGAIVESYAYDGYGQPTVQIGAPPPDPGIGPRFAFTGQRLDALDPINPGSPPGPANARLLLYDYKARAFSPRLGRFLQRDPAEFADGMNLYEYASSRPEAEVDPTGEFSYPEISVSSAIRAGINGLKWYNRYQQVKYVAQQLHAGVSITEIFRGLLIDSLLDRIGGKAFDVALGALGRFTKFFSKLGKHCCFVEGTQVQTPHGPVAIECLKPGDLVLTRDEMKPAGETALRPVKQVFTRVASVVLWLTLSNGHVLGTTPGRLVWSNEQGWTYAGDMHPGETFLDEEGVFVTLLFARVDDVPVVTYNLEVADTGTYFAEGVWVHNVSCPARKPIEGRPPHGGPLHDSYGVKRAGQIAAEQGPNVGATVRWNQDLVGPDGVRIPGFRPDIQYVKDGKVFIEEVAVSQSASAVFAKEEGYRALLGDLFGGYEPIILGGP